MKLTENRDPAQQQTTKLNPDLTNSQGYYKLGQAFAEQGKIDQAINFYQQACAQEETFLLAYYKLAEMQLRQKDLDSAQACFEHIIKQDFNQPQAHYQLGRILFHQGQFAFASEKFRQTIQLAPKSSLAYRQLGLTLEKQKKWDEALKYFLKALFIQPNFSHILNDIGRILEQQTKPEEALICYQSGNIPLNLIRKYSQSTKQWSVVYKSSAIKGVKYLDGISLASQGRLSPPKSIYQNIPDTLSKTEFKFRPSYVTFVDNGRAWADHLTSAVMTPSNQLLANVSTGCSHLIVASDNLTSAYEIEGTVAFLSSRWGSQFYFHWMLETLPRIELLCQSGIGLDNINKFCFHGCKNRFNQETLDILAIPPEKIIDNYDYPHVKAKKLVVPSIMESSRGANWAINFLRREFLCKQVSLSDYPKHIYISRKSKRRIINEAEVEDLLAKYGFKSVSLESMSVLEQASLFAAAEFVIAPHGGGLTNMVFCPTGAKIIEIFSPRYLHQCYWTLSNHCGLEYYYLVGEDLYDQTIVDNAQNIIVDLKLLYKTLMLSGI